MRSGFLTRTTSSSVVRRLIPWAVVLIIGALLIGVMPIAQAQTGASASDAIPIGTDGKFAGTDGPSQSLWYKFNYVGGGQKITVSLTFEPADSTRLDFFLFTGDPSNPTQFGTLSTLNGNTRTLDYTDPNIYTGTDPTTLCPTQQGGSQVKNGNTVSRHMNLAAPQFVFFSLANNGSVVIAYGGTVSPFTAPPPTATPTAAVTGTAT